MWTLLRKLPPVSRPARRPARRPSFRPQVETLEGRLTPGRVGISIDDVKVLEGNFDPTPPDVNTRPAGVPNSATFTVSLSAPAPAGGVQVDYATSDGTAQALGLTRIASGLSRPLAAVVAPGDDNRLFIAEQFSGTTGRIRILDRGTGALQDAASPFLAIPNVSNGNEQGLLGLAFDPNFQKNGYFYVTLTTNVMQPGIPPGGAGYDIIRRFQVSANDPDHADPSSGTNVLVIPDPESNHNGGWLEFGPDGYLYAAFGDGGGANDQHGTIGNGQNLNALLGKILRIDPSGDDFPGDPNFNYHIPETNPFVGRAGARGEIWAWGLRNPFRNGFDRQTGDLYIGDVGQNTREEVDFQPAGSPGGENYGWRTWEGVIRTPGVTSPPPTDDMLFPIIDLLHSGSNSAFALIGGYVYRGPIPELQGMYLFGDNATGRIWALRYDGTLPFNGINYTDFARLYDASASVPDLLVPDVGTLTRPSSFGQDSQGNLFIVDLGTGASNGQVYLLTGGGDFAPVRGRLNIPAGQTSGTISVQITGDRLPEGDETFFVNLSNPSANADIVRDQGQGTIIDDDVPPVQIINDGDAGFSTSGNWRTRVSKHYFQGDVHYAGPGNGHKTATWTVTGLVPGTYQVAATWFARPRASMAAPFTIAGGDDALGVFADQTQAPADFSDSGADWQILADAYSISGDTLTVTLSTTPDGFVEADAVRIQLVAAPLRLGGPGRGTPERHARPAGADSEVWSDADGVAPGGAGAPAWVFAGLSADTYGASATRSALPVAADVPVVRTDRSRGPGNVPVDPPQRPAGLAGAVARWRDPGLLPVTADTPVSGPSDLADGSPEADAGRIA